MKRIADFFTDTLFRREFRSKRMQALARQYRLFFYTARGLQEHGTMLRCAALTFYTLISIVPILAVVFGIVKGFGILEALIANLYSAFPQTPEVVDYMVQFADRALLNTSGGVVAVAGVAMLFWAVIRVFGSIESAFNNIWELSSSRSIAVKYPVYITIVVVVPLLWAAVGGADSYLRAAMGSNPEAADIVLRALSLAAVWAAFAFLYYIIPNTSVKIGSALTAGIVAGTFFMMFQWAYVWAQQLMTSYNAIYGSFAALPLFLLWVQWSWTILLFGGELAFAYQNIDRFDEERESLRIDYDSRRKVALAVMHVVVRRFTEGGTALTVSEIRRQLDMPVRIVNSVLDTLVEARLLAVVPAAGKKDEQSYLPATDPHRLTLYGVLEAMDNAGEPLRERDLRGVVKRMSDEMESLKKEARTLSANRPIADTALKHDKQ